jgi:predicted secreted Zn-dependent protease
LTSIYRFLGLIGLLVSGAAHAADWTATEQVKPYSVSGSTPIELYESIGAKGPLLGGSSRAIAYTTFDLKWRRDYQPQADGSCRLMTAIPFLTIIYSWPQPAQQLAEPTAGRWATFIEGIKRHEKVHGDMIREMTQRILDTTVGLTVADDPGCTKIRQEMQKPLAAASEEQRALSRDFDRVEMSNGGNVHQLVLNLVNGG